MITRKSVIAKNAITDTIFVEFGTSNELKVFQPFTMQFTVTFGINVTIFLGEGGPSKPPPVYVNQSIN